MINFKYLFPTNIYFDLNCLFMERNNNQSNKFKSPIEVAKSV